MNADLRTIERAIAGIRQDILALRTHLDTRLNRSHERQIRMAQELDALTASVARNGDVIASAITLIQGIKAKLDEAIAAGNDPAKLQALSDSLGSQDQQLADAVAANTPAAP